MIQRIQKLTKSKGLRQSLITIIGNMGATGLSAIALIIISRILGPEKFGAFNIGFALVLIITRINDLGISAATLRLAAAESDKKKINQIFHTGLKFKILISLIIIPIGIFISPALAKIINFDQPVIISLAFVFGLSTVYYEQLLVMLQSLHLFTKAVIVNAIQAGTKLITALSLFVLHSENIVLVFSLYVLAPFVPVIFMKKFLPKWSKIGKIKRSIRIEKKLKNLALHFSLALLSAGVIENIDVFFIQKSLSTFETGLYSGVSRIAMVFALIAYSMGNVLYPRVAKYKEKSHLQSYLKKSAGVVFLSILGFLAFLPFSKWFILLTIGPEYISGMAIMNLLVLASFLAIASIPFIALFYTLNANWYFSLSAIFQLLIVIIGNLVFVPMYGLTAAAWTRLATRVFLFVFTATAGIIMYRKEYGKKTQTIFSKV